MKKLWGVIIATISIFILIHSISPLSLAQIQQVPAQVPTISPLEPRACEGGGYPEKLCKDIYEKRGETCVVDYESFKADPVLNHFWAEDEQVTSQGKANERARQFISWVLNNRAIDNHPAIRAIWGTTRNLTYFFVVLLAVILGIGFIVGQRTNFQLKIQVWPSVLKIGAALLFVTFSASIVLLLIDLSEILMRFFIENLGAKDLFNIYFSGGSSQEANYVKFYGCRDLNYGVQESAKTQMFMMHLTNITYYIMGVVLLLRKILLWFLLFVSPFLAILFPFAFVRNVGWIWIGVFFQWLMYGPLFALFLGALSRIWKDGIPFIFDFGRASTAEGYIYPTATNILYGGPAQKLNVLNSGNYVDTFAEYVITLIMLAAVIFFPWWLLRIFRSYCCDGIAAMKNILLSMYDQMRSGPPSSPQGPIPSPTHLNTSLKVSQDMEIPVRTKLETIEEIKKTRTEEISKTLNLKATKLTDIARIETNVQTKQEIKQNLDFLSNPTKATTPTERQKYMNLRTELFNRAIKEDTIAKQILSATTTNGAEQIQNRNKILQTTPTLTPVSQIVSYKVKLPTEKVSSITNSLADAMSANTGVMQDIAQKSQVAAEQAQTVLASYKQQVNKPNNAVVENIAKDTGLQKETIEKVMKQVAETVKTNNELAASVAQKEQVKQEDVQQIVQAQMPLIAEPERNVEQAIAIPATISIEDYEEVKKMWVQQYEKGEVPVTENLNTRAQWVEQDIVFITNTLNKLVSQEDTMKQQGMDEVGFILPIFMINNLKGEELLVYLKAKLEAAKLVQSQIDKEKEITEKLKAKTEEVLVDVPAEKKEEAKTMTMQEELTIDGEKKE